MPHLSTENFLQPKHCSDCTAGLVHSKAETNLQINLNLTTRLHILTFRRKNTFEKIWNNFPGFLGADAILLHCSLDLRGVCAADLNEAESIAFGALSHILISQYILLHNI